MSNIDLLSKQETIVSAPLSSLAHGHWLTHIVFLATFLFSQRQNDDLYSSKTSAGFSEAFTAVIIQETTPGGKIQYIHF